MISNNKQALCLLLKSTHLSQLRLRIYIRSSELPDIRSVLEQQLREYGAIEREARCVAIQRGWELPESDPAACFFTAAAAAVKLRFCRGRRIVKLSIRNSTENMIHAYTLLNRLSGQDRKLKILLQKLLDSENAIIRAMQFFL